MTKSFEKRELLELFQKIGGKIAKPMNVFLLGGGAMVFRNQKNGTKDLDLVFENKQDADAFAKTLVELGFKQKQDLEEEYKQMSAQEFLFLTFFS